MGLFHCIPEPCSTVRWREYLPPKIRWRYPGEIWQEIDGDNYSTEVVPDLSRNTAYRIKYRSYKTTPDGQPSQWDTTERTLSTQYIIDGIESWWLDVDHPNPIYPPRSFYKRYPPEARYVTREILGNVTPPSSYRTANFRLGYISKGIETIRSVLSEVGIWFTNLEAVDPAKRTSACVFRIYRNGQIVHQETRSVCPEVEKTAYQLSNDIKERSIDKVAYTERIEIRDQSITPIFVGPTDLPLIDVKPLPRNCLNIYSTYTLAPPLLSEYVPLPGVLNPYSFIQQICSVSGGPPPEYEVICGCTDCEKCPPETCPVYCDGQICCYNDYGVSVKEIPIDRYCEE